MKILYIGNKLALKGKTPTSIETLGNYLINEGYSLVRYSEKKNQLLRLMHMIYGMLKHSDVNYVIIDTYSTSAFWYAFITSQLARILNIKYILCLRGGDLPNRLDKNPKISKWMFNNSYINASPSGYLKHEFEKRGFKNLKLVPNTIEIENYPFLDREIKSPKILWVRSFAALYNPKLAIDIFVEIQKKYSDAELCMVGPEKDGTLEQTIAYAKQKNVTVLFTGKMEKADWITISKNYNIFLNTTNFDNTPVSVMEAMALGLPIISTNVGGLPYLIEDKKNGFLTNPDDPSEMIEIIEMLIQNPNICHQVIKNARIKAESWDWNQVKNIWNLLLK